MYAARANERDYKKEVKKTLKKKRKEQKGNIKNNKNTNNDRQIVGFENEEKIKRIFSICLFVTGIVLFFISIIKGEGVWEFVRTVTFGLFGFSSYIFPVIFIYLSIKLALSKKNGIKVGKTIGCVLLLISIPSFACIIKNQGSIDFLNDIKSAYLYYLNTASTAGFGVLGAFFGGIVLLITGCSKAAALAIIFLSAFFALMLATETDVVGLCEIFKKIFKFVKEKIKEKKENKEKGAEEIKEKKNHQPIINKIAKQKNAKEINDAILKTLNERNNIDKICDDNKVIDNTVVDNHLKSIDEILKNAINDKPENKKEEIKEKNIVESKAQSDDYTFPSIDILEKSKAVDLKGSEDELKANAETLIDTLQSFGVETSLTNISRGPTVTRYELKPATGVRINKITNLSDDIALNLAATSVRIEAPIPGKAAVGIEIPNKIKQSVSMREMVDTPEFNKQKSKLSAGLGKDIGGNCVYCDIAKMPHLLIAGTTGSGKSVCMNTIIVSMLYKATPDEVKFLMIDPKKVEFSKYEGIPHLLVPVVTDARKAAGALGWAVSEMLQRYQKFSETGVRDIEGYNKFVKTHEEYAPMPKIVIFIDELADLMMAAPKEVEDSICRLAQMARAAGMHLVIATQRPSVDVITGLIKANISSRIALTVSSAIDSRTILDSSGAEKLLGRGDMLFNPIGASKPLRVQGAFISDEEVEELCNSIKTNGQADYNEDVQKEIEEKAVQEKNKNNDIEIDDEYDALFDAAVDIVLENGTASTSFLQRKLGVGYSRGAKIIDQLQANGIIGPSNGSKPREILMNREDWEFKKAENTNSAN